MDKEIPNIVRLDNTCNKSHSFVINRHLISNESFKIEEAILNNSKRDIFLVKRTIIDNSDYVSFSEILKGKTIIASLNHIKSNTHLGPELFAITKDDKDKYYLYIFDMHTFSIIDFTYLDFKITRIHSLLILDNGTILIDVAIADLCFVDKFSPDSGVTLLLINRNNLSNGKVTFFDKNLDIKTIQNE